MQRIPNTRTLHNVVRASVFLTMVALIAGTIGCVPDQQEYTPMLAASYHVVGLSWDYCGRCGT